jgi:DMSO/TMAO reductase YedYZ molybdopterin-dependent catalytic subunit
MALGVGGAGIALGLANLGARLNDPGDKLLNLTGIRRARRPQLDPTDADFDDVEGLTPEVTSNQAHYVVDEEILDPVVDPNGWTLTIDGLVDRKVVLTYDDLVHIPSVERYQTLMCISNEIGGDLISTALWTGVPLKTILDRAGINPAAAEVVFRAVGGYSDSLPADQAMDESTLIAIGMNGHVLPRAHGFPARLLSTGTYGYKNPKWLGEIEVVESPYTGFWQHRGWDKEGRVNTMSRIDVPESGDVPAGSVTIGGIAFAADRGVARVEISDDDGGTWHEARLKTALSDVTWRLWLLEWEPPGPGEYELLVRAQDGTGAVQISRHASPFPSGSTGYDAVTVTV